MQLSKFHLVAIGFTIGFVIGIFFGKQAAASEQVSCSEIDAAVAAAFSAGNDDLAYKLSLRQLECADEALTSLKGAIDRLENGLGRLTRVVVPGVDI